MLYDFYTYIYLDPRKPGIYQYGDYKFNYEPFYVGKGKNKQYITHLVEAKNNEEVPDRCWNSYKFNKIKNILKENQEPIILKVEKDLSEKESFDLEIWLIWAIGKRSYGCLTNLTDGGDGVSGFGAKGEKNGMFGKHQSEEFKERLRQWYINHPPTEEARKKMSHKGEKNGNYGKGLFGENNPFFGKTHSEETKKRISETKKGKPRCLLV
jgi:hypothetical protein